MNKTSIFKRLTFEQQRISFSCEQMYRTDTQTSFFPELFIFFFSFWMYYIVVISYGSSLPHYDLYSLELFEYLLIDQKVICFLSINNNIRHIFFSTENTFLLSWNKCSVKNSSWCFSLNRFDVDPFICRLFNYGQTYECSKCRGWGDVHV